MSYDPTNENEALDPATGLPVDGPSAGAPEPPPPPPAPPTGDPLFDEPGYAAAAPAAGTSRVSSTGVDKKTLIGAGIGAAVIALGAVVGINLASSGAENTANTAASGPMGMNGQPGQMPGATQGDTTDGSTGGQAQGQMPGGQGGPGGMPGSTGTIDSIGDGTLTLTTDAGESVEVTTTDDTEVSISAEGSADDIDEGDTVLVLGQSSDDSSVTAERVVERSGDAIDAQGGPGGRGGGMGPISGEVSSVDGDSFVVSTDSGDVTVTMTDDTTIVIERTGSVSDLSEGDEVFVHTETSDDGSAVAERIIAGDALPDAGMGGPPSGMQGGPSGPSGSTGQSGTMTPPSQGGADSSGTSGAPGTTGGAPGADAGPSGVTTT